MGASQTKEVCYGFGDCEEELTDDGAGLVVIGAIGFIGIRIAEYVDAYRTAKDHNKDLRRKKYSIEIRQVGDTPTISLAYRF